MFRKTSGIVPELFRKSFEVSKESSPGLSRGRIPCFSCGFPQLAHAVPCPTQPLEQAQTTTVAAEGRRCHQTRPIKSTLGPTRRVVVKPVGAAHARTSACPGSKLSVEDNAPSLGFIQKPSTATPHEPGRRRKGPAHRARSAGPFPGLRKVHRLPLHQRQSRTRLPFSRTGCTIAVRRPGYVVCPAALLSGASAAQQDDRIALGGHPRPQSLPHPNRSCSECLEAMTRGLQWGHFARGEPIVKPARWMAGLCIFRKGCDPASYRGLFCPIRLGAKRASHTGCLRQHPPRGYRFH